MYTLPTSISVNEKSYKIRQSGDFRMVLDCFSALNDEELGEDYRVLTSLIIFYEDCNSISDVLSLGQDTVQQLVAKMFQFFSAGVQEGPSNMPSKKLIDWDNDSTIICAAINNVAKQEVRSLPYLHWWTFLGYYMSVGESVLSTVVSIRNKILKGTKLEKWEQTFRRENPQYFNWRHASMEDEDATAALRKLWSQGGT